MREESVFKGVNPIQLGEILNERRSELGLSLQQIADELTLSVGTVHNLMSGKHTYPVGILARVAGVLEWSIVDVAKKISPPKVTSTPTMRRVRALMVKAKDGRPRHE